MKNRVKILLLLIAIVVISIYSYKNITQSREGNITKTSYSSGKKIALSTDIKDNLNKKELAETDYSSSFSSETQLPMVNSEGYLLITYNNVLELYVNAEIVALVKVKNENVFFTSDTSVATTSTADVKQIYKGDMEIKELKITEVGGPIDLSKLPKVDKPGDGKVVNQGLVEETFEGSVVMKNNNTYLVFLKKCSDSSYGYNVLGSVQGKIKIEEETKKALITVSKENFDETQSLFFLQKQFGGNNITDIVSAFRK